MLSHPMTRVRRALLIATLLAATGGGVAACGEEGIDASSGGAAARPPSSSSSAARAATRSSAAGHEGSTTNMRTREYKDGPNFDQRQESANCVLYAIRNGGFSSGPMPQNIVVGQQAEELAEFVAENSAPRSRRRRAEAEAGRDCPAAVARARPEGDQP